MGSQKSSIKAKPRISRPTLPTTPSKLPSIPISDLHVMRAVIQSTCCTCDLKYRPGVFKFLKTDLPLFHNVTLEDGGHQRTTLLLLNKDDKILNSLPLWDNSREECNLILQDLGFYKKSEQHGSVPQEFKNGPYPILRSPLHLTKNSKLKTCP